MPTTALGIRYPASGDAAAIATYFQNLATDVNNLIDPLSWTALAAAGGWTVGTPTFRYAKDSLGRVWLRGQMVNTASFTPNGDLIATLPVNFRPTGDVIFTCFNSSTTAVHVRITSTGRVEAFRSAGGVSIAAGTGWALDPIHFPTA